MNDRISSVTFVFVFLGVATSELYPSIQWTPTNPLFSQNRTQCVYPMSKVIFVCPNPAMVVGIQQDGTARQMMYENLWLVDKQGYDQCKVNRTNPTTKLLLQCSNPLKLNFYTVGFHKYSAQVGGPEYEPGKQYYFIATSDGTQLSLDNQSGGHCRTKNMRLEFHVCSNETDVHCKSPDKCNIREDPTQSSTPTTAQKSDSTAITTTLPPTKKAGNKTKHNVPCNPDKSGTNTTKYNIVIGMLVTLNIVLLLSTSYLLYRRMRQKQTRRRPDDVHVTDREKLQSKLIDPVLITT